MIDKIDGGFIITPLQSAILESVQGYVSKVFISLEFNKIAVDQLVKRHLIVELPKVECYRISFSGIWALFVYKKQMLAHRRLQKILTTLP